MDTQNIYSSLRSILVRGLARGFKDPRLARQLKVNLLSIALLLVQFHLSLSDLYAQTPTAAAAGTPSLLQRLEEDASKMVRTADAQRHFAALSEKVGEETSQPYIIQLRLPYRPEGELKDPALVEAQREMIVRVRLRLLEGLIGHDRTSLKIYRYLPLVGLRLNRVGLAMISESVHALDIQEDGVLYPNQLGQAGSASSGFGTGINGAPVNNARPTIAFLDTGIDKSHPALTGRVVAESCYSSNNPLSGVSSLCPGGNEQVEAVNSGIPCEISGADCDHGTHVAGIAAADPSGLAPEASLISIQVASRLDSAEGCDAGLSSCLVSFTSDHLLGLERIYDLRAERDIAAVNIGFSGGSYRGGCDVSEPAYKAGIELLRSVDIATIAPSGNSGNFEALGAPACLAAAISVGATREKSGQAPQIASFSNVSSVLKLVAPGESINSTISGGNFAIGSGTSMASAAVAGAWARIRQSSAVRDVTAILGALTMTGTPIKDTRNDLSFPRINVEAAINSLNTLASSSGPPLTPSNLVGSTFSTNQINLRWTDNSSDEMGFLIYIKLASDTCPSGKVYDPLKKSCVDHLAYDLVGPNISQYKVFELEPGTTYAFYVVAYNVYGRSNSSNTTQAQTLKLPIVPPTTLSAISNNSTRVILNWKDNSNNENGFRIMRRLSSSGVWTTVANLTNNPCSTKALSPSTEQVCFLNEALNPNTEYVYQVMAYNSTVDSIKSNEAKVVTLGATTLPQAPSDLTVNAYPVKFRPKMALLRWKDNANNEAGYRITRRSMVGNSYTEWIDVTTLPANSTELINVGLVAGTTYFYRVAAFNALGEVMSDQEAVFHAPMYNFVNINNGETIIGSMIRDEEVYYRIIVPDGTTSMVVQTIGRGGLSAEDIDIRIGGPTQPTRDNFFMASANKGVNESISVANPTPGDWYILVSGYSWFKSNYRLTVRLTGSGAGLVR